jgi:hypothetical protein
VLNACQTLSADGQKWSNSSKAPAAYTCSIAVLNLRSKPCNNLMQAARRTPVPTQTKPHMALEKAWCSAVLKSVCGPLHISYGTATMTNLLKRCTAASKEYIHLAALEGGRVHTCCKPHACCQSRTITVT